MMGLSPAFNYNAIASCLFSQTKRLIDPPGKNVSTIRLKTQMEKFVEISNQEFSIDFNLGTKCRSTSVTLKSLSTKSPVVFNVQTSSPQKFLIDPPGGFIPPLSSTTLQVILKPQNRIPSTFPRSPSDRFIIRTALAPRLDVSSSTEPESINLWFNLLPSNVVTSDIKLKVVFVGEFLLRHAVSVGDYESVRSIIKRQRSLIPHFSSTDSESLYRVATRLDNSEEMVDLLLEAGLKLAGTDDDVRWLTKRWTGLHLAVTFDRTDDVERIVRSKEAAVMVDAIDTGGRTPLHLAANRGYLRCAKLLLSAGATVDVRSNDGRTPLFRAVANGDRRMVEALIEMGANPTITEIEPGCRSAIDVANHKGQHEIIKILEQGEAVLHAARRGELDLLESLLIKGATMKFSDQYGMTALHMAAIKGNKAAVSILIKFGADLECQDCEGHTALNLAVKSRSIETVELLINGGADVNAMSKKGATPLHVSSLMGYGDISQLLLKNGAEPRSILL